MKKNFVLLSSIAVVATLSVMVIFNRDSQGKYSPRTAQQFEKKLAGDANGMLAWMAEVQEGFSNEDRKRAIATTKMLPQNRASLAWTDHGPDNIGGRTRAILVDRNDINHVYAGSVSGGLWESFNRTNTWQQVTTFADNYGISSMCQTIDGTLFIGTGHLAERSLGSEDSGLNGDGVFYSVPGGFEQIPETAGLLYVNEVVADTVNNHIWIACSGGLLKYIPSTGELVDSPAEFGNSGVTALSLSKDGQVMVLRTQAASATYISNDGGQTFSNVTGTTSKIPSTGSRYEYAISHEKKNGNYTIYGAISSTSGKLIGIWRTTDYGNSWEEIAPRNTGRPGSFEPFASDPQDLTGQGNYNNIITVQKGNPDRIFVGGIVCYAWSKNGNWEQISRNFFETLPNYVHSDVHEMTWDNTGRLYVGSDGGIHHSDDNGKTFNTANRGYNVTQFYGLGFSAHGDVMGGTQDNGTLINYHNGHTFQSHYQVLGGDGFASAMSFINRNVYFMTLYYELVYSNGHGNLTPSYDEVSCEPGLFPEGTQCGNFPTKITLWENPKDLNSTDSVKFVPLEDYEAGAEIEIESRTSGVTIPYTTTTSLVVDDTLYANPALTTKDTLVTQTETPISSVNLNQVDYEYLNSSTPPIAIQDTIRYININGEYDTIVVGKLELVDHFYGTNPERPGKVKDMENDSMLSPVAWDTVTVQDYYQSWLALGIGSGHGVWLTRNGLRFNQAPNWIYAGNGMATINDLQFSKDGNHLFMGCADGSIWRLSGFNTVYSPDPETDTLLRWNTVHSATTLENIGNVGTRIQGITTGMDPDHVVVATGSGSGSVHECTNATGGSPSWTNIGGGLPSQPFYACVIDRNDPNLIMVGGEVGVFLTTSGGQGSDAWEFLNTPFGNVPVHEIGQNWRTWEQGCRRPGEIYVATHGRGIWSTDEFLNLPSENDNLVKEKFVSNIKIYPNPVREVGNITFNLDTQSDVAVQVFNLKGQMVMQHRSNSNSIGTNTIQLATSGLKNGTYIVRLTSGNMVETTKFIKY